ncbi:MAG: hypothetical protein GY940_10980, partial [bacterium]|nr:hypothetical protein [bacterium]
QDKEQSAQYWENVLDTFEEQTGISYAKVKPGTRGGANGVRAEARNRANRDAGEYGNQSFSFLLDSHKTAALKRMAARNHVTLNVVNQAVWGILLGKYNGKEDVVFGAVVSGRPPGLEGVETMIGLFINTIPVRIRFQDKMKFRQLIQNVQQDAVAAEPHHYHPLAAIQSRTYLKQNLLDHLFIFENYPLAEQIEGYGNDNNKGKNNNDPSSLKLSNVTDFTQTNYDLNLIMAGADQLNIGFNYNSNVVDSNIVRRISGHFRRIVDQVVDNEAIVIDELRMLSDSEKQQLLVEFNDTACEYPMDKSIHGLFEEQVERTHHRIALVGPKLKNTNNKIQKNSKFQIPNKDEPHFTYRQLNTGAEGLAGQLIDKGVTTGTIVAIMTERSVEMIIG